MLCKGYLSEKLISTRRFKRSIVLDKALKDGENFDCCDLEGLSEIKDCVSKGLGQRWTGRVQK